MISLPWKIKKPEFYKKFFNKKREKSLCPQCYEFSHGMQIDEVEIEIEDVTMRVKRKVNLEVPHEVSAFIPRAEIRRRTFRDGQLASEEEILLNSITIVHAPRHPLAGESNLESKENEQVLRPGSQKYANSNSIKNNCPKISLNFPSPISQITDQKMD